MAIPPRSTDHPLTGTRSHTGDVDGPRLARGLRYLADLCDKNVDGDCSINIDCPQPFMLTKAGPGVEPVRVHVHFSTTMDVEAFLNHVESQSASLLARVTARIEKEVRAQHKIGDVEYSGGLEWALTIFEEEIEK